jgi:glycine/D-amino acid oxidase-like deaminating enzyme
LALSKYDIVVVGAGILGLSAAYHLLKNSPGKSVLVIDRMGDVGQGNTARANALFRNTFTSIDNRILADTSINFYLHVQNDLGLDLGVELLGYLWTMSSKQLSANSKHVARMISNGIEIREYDGNELRSLIPGLVTAFDGNEEASVMNLSDIDAGVFGAKCGRLDPDKLVRYYRDQFLRLGGKIALNTKVDALIFEPSTSLGIEGEPFVWQDALVKKARVSGQLSGEVGAETFIISAGAWANKLLEPVGLDGHVKAKKRQLFQVSAESNPDLRKLVFNKNFNTNGIVPVVILPKSGVHTKPVKESMEFWIGCEDEVNREFIDIPEEDLDLYEPERSYYENSVYPILKEYLPQFKNVGLKNMWAGLYSFNTLDYLPFVFSESGLIVVGGDSGSGLMKGDALGRVVAAVYGGETNREALLYGDVPYRASKIGFAARDVEREEWVI